MNTIISLDPSIVTTGYAIFKGRSLESHGTIRIKRDGEVPERLYRLVCALRDVLDGVKGGVTQAVIENMPTITYGRSAGNRGKTLNMSALLKLSMATGALTVALMTRGIPVKPIGVMEWKGRQKGKGVTQEQARLIYGVLVNDHVADAVMIGHYYISRYNEGAHRKG